LKYHNLDLCNWSPQLGAASHWNLWCTQMQQTLRCHSLISRLTLSIFLHHITLSFTFKYWVWQSNFNRWQTTGKGKVKCSLVQALGLCKGSMDHRGNIGIALLFLDHGTGRGWGVSIMPRPLFTPEKDPVSIVQEAVLTPGPVWAGAEILARPGFHPRTVQPVASRYTDWATQPTQTTEYNLNKIILEKWILQDICTWPSTYAWDKQQMDIDRLCNKGKVQDASLLLKWL